MTHSPTTRQTSIDIVLTFSRQFLSGLMQLGILLIIARALGPEGAGTFAVALLLPTIMSQLLNLGLASASVYFIASGQFSLTQVWVSSRDLVLIMGGLGGAFGVALVLLVGEQVFPNIAQTVLLAAFMIFPTSLIAGMITALFQALQDFRTFNILVLVQPVFSLIGIGVLWVFGSINVTLSLSIVALSHACAMVAALTFLKRHTPLIESGGARMEYLRPAVAYGIKAHLSNILTFLNYRLDMFLVNLLAGPAAAGIYTIAVRLTEQLWIISQAVSTVVFPRLSAMISDEVSRREFTPLLARFVLWITLLAAGLLAAIAQPLIYLLFGDQFDGAVAALLILLPGIVLMSVSRIVANDFAARGWVGYNLALAGTALIINTILNVLLIPHFGFIGAALATTFSYIFNLIARLTLQWRLIRVPWWECCLPTQGDLGAIKRALFKA